MTSLRDQGLVSIEAGLNETADRSRNPHIPYTAPEVAAAGVAAVRAGASILHFHARNADGSQDWTGADIYREAMSLIAEEVDAICYPSYIATFDHVFALDDRPPRGTRLQVTPFDVVQHFRRTMWDFDERRIRANTALDGDTTRPDYAPELDEFKRRGLVPTVAVFELGEVKWAVRAVECGILDTPLDMKIFLTDTWMKGPFADVTGLESFLSQVPDGLDAEITVVPYEMETKERTERLLRAALDRGHNIRVGIGDNPRAWPEATSAELVEWAVGLVAGVGAKPATPADVRARHGLPHPAREARA